MKIIAIHSFHRGTGKSNLAANVAVLLAEEGQRVAIIDADVQSPAMHIVLGLNEEAITHTLNTFLRGQCEIEQAAYTVALPPNQSGSQGQVLLVPASSHPVEIARVLREGYAPRRLNDGIRQLAAELVLDAVIVDTHAGLNEEMLASLAASDVLALVMRLDHQDYQGTAIVIELARRLDLPRILLIVNEVPPTFDLAEVKARIGQAYECQVIAALPHSEDFMTNASAGPFVLRFPAHPMTVALKQIAADLTADRDTPTQDRAS